MKNEVDMKMIVKSLVAFAVLTPVLIIGISYLPVLRITLDPLTEGYFMKNVLNDFGLKVIIATFVAGVLTIFGTLLIYAPKIGQGKK